jgi:hypothetical protein
MVQDKRYINVGNQSNDGTGDSIREAFKKVNANFQELYGINNLGEGLFFTKLKDAPSKLNASTPSTATILVVDYFGNTLTQKSLIAGQGIVIVNSATTLSITNPNASLKTDQAPQLGANIDGNNFKGINFADPEDPQDLATKYYVDHNGFFSTVNLYVSTSGRDSFPDEVPEERRGRSLAYAFRTINKACQAAETIINTSTVELGANRQYITLNNGASTATVYATEASPYVPNDIRVYIKRFTYAGTDQWISKDIRPGQYLRGADSTTAAFIDDLGQTIKDGYDCDYFDVQYKAGPGFIPGEFLEYTVRIPKTHITILIESGTYLEQLPIRVPTNVSIRGDEFRRVIIKPDMSETGGISSSTWSKLWFRRDASFDGLTSTSTNGRNILATPGYEFGYHYLTNPTQINSTPKLNDQMDVFLMNDATILRAITAQGHGGFMCVLDPEGQILTKSPYIQNCASFSKSINKQTFSGGIFVDGFAGNIRSTPGWNTDVGYGSTYWEGTLTVHVSGLTQRDPQTPTAFWNKGNRYEIDFYTTASTSTAVLGEGTLHLNPRGLAGLSFSTGTVWIDPGGSGSGPGGAGYNFAPRAIFSQPSEPGGYPAQGVAVINAFGAVERVTVSNPGSGYVGTASITFVGGNPTINAVPKYISTSNVKVGYIGYLPNPLEIMTAGNKSMLSADFTQVNDLGYGFIVTNNGLQENVSDFTYYNYVSYYSHNGGQIRSLNGSTAYGTFGLKSTGADPNEVPLPVYVNDDMVQTGTVVSHISIAGINTLNTVSSTVLYLRGLSYTPYNGSEIEVDHGLATDSLSNVLGVQTYQVVSVSTVSSVAVPGLTQMNLSASSGLGLASTGLKAAISSGTVVVVRNSKQVQLVGVNVNTIVRPSTALKYDESTGTSYRVINFDGSGLSSGIVRATTTLGFDYVSLTTLIQNDVPPITPGALSFKIAKLDSINDYRVRSSTATTATALTFGWKNQVYRITAYSTGTESNATSGTIYFTPALATTITNLTNTATGVVLKAGIRKYTSATITTRISTTRATNHDMLDVGSGGYEESNYPNDIFGPPRNTPSPAYERIEPAGDVGRVFAVTSDQDGNFKVGDYFAVDQGTGDLKFSGQLTLTGISGLQFSRGGAEVKEFSTFEDMTNARSDTVPTELAVVGYVAKRLGVSVSGIVQPTLLGPGFLDLTGLQTMKGSIQMGGNAINMANAKITNITTSTAAGEYANAANKWYVDAYVSKKLSLAGTESGDPITGSQASSFGIMTGPLILNSATTTSSFIYQAATRWNVDSIRQVSTLSDVTLTNLADTDLLMFAGTLSVNTQSQRPIYNATRQIVNVANNIAQITNSSTSTGGGSDITITRSTNTVTNANTVTFKLVGGQGASNPITNYHVNDNAAIAQSKLAMNYAVAGAWGGSSPTQANLGLARMDSSYFVSTGGFITLYSPTNFPVNVQTANKVNNTLTRGLYLTGSNFDGSLATTWAVDGTSTNVASKVVTRDASGNFSAGTVSASLSGVATCANNLRVDSDQYRAACTASSASTIVARDANCDIYARIFCGDLCGTALQAKYADLAENYQADQHYGPCVVLEFGGRCEVTMASIRSRAVAGVVSTNPAYLMNSDLKGDNVVTLALQGRVPCKVKGPIRKGDLLVSAGDGFARSDPDPKIGAVIGKALENFDSEEGIIEIVVGRI